MSESDLLLLLLLLLFLLFLASSYFPSNSSSSRHRDWRLSILRHLGSPIPLRPTDPSEQELGRTCARVPLLSPFFSFLFFSLFPSCIASVRRFSSHFLDRSIWRVRVPLFAATLSYSSVLSFFGCAVSITNGRCLSADRKSGRARSRSLECFSGPWRKWRTISAAVLRIVDFRWFPAGDRYPDFSPATRLPLIDSLPVYGAAHGSVA